MCYVWIESVESVMCLHLYSCPLLQKSMIFLLWFCVTSCDDFLSFFFLILNEYCFFQHLSIMIVESKSCGYSFFMCIFEYFQIATLCVMDFVLIDLTQAFGCWLYQVDLLTWFLSSDNVIRKILFFSSIKTMNFISWFTNLYGTTVEFRISV